jgi:hypothetical protein
MRKAGNENDF